MRLGKAWLFVQASLVGFKWKGWKTRKARIMGEVKFDFKVVAKSKALKLQRGSHPSNLSRPRQDYPKCMKTSSFQGQDNKYKQVRVVMRKFLRTSSSIQGFTSSQGLNKFIR